MMSHKAPKKAIRGRSVDLKILVSEADWQQQVRQIARLYGWTMQYHTYDARRSEPGWPDLVLHHPFKGRTIFVELKTQRGKVSEAQAAWLTALDMSGMETALWRPTDVDAVQGVLGPSQQPTRWVV